MNAPERPDWGRAVLRSLGVVILGLAIVRLGLVLAEPFGQRFLGNDLNGYLAGASRFLETGSPYLPEQLSGAWQLQPDSFIHPPVALVLFLPFLYMPAIAWWAIPIGLTIWAVIRLRPAPWAWPVMAACLLWPRTAGILIAGNSDMWVAAALVVALAFALPAAVLLVMKPSYLPLALVGATRSNWRMAAVGAAIACLLFMNLWFDYLAVLRGVSLEPLYSLYNAPYVAIPLIAWLARSRPVRAPETTDSAPSSTLVPSA
jgi:hypothetical protein